MKMASVWRDPRGEQERGSSGGEWGAEAWFGLYKHMELRGGGGGGGRSGGNQLV